VDSVSPHCKKKRRRRGKNKKRKRRRKKRRRRDDDDDGPGNLSLISDKTRFFFSTQHPDWLGFTESPVW
jgi:hypothetical protein